MKNTSRKIDSYITCALLDVIYRFFTPIFDIYDRKISFNKSRLSRFSNVVLTSYLIIYISIKEIIMGYIIKDKVITVNGNTWHVISKYGGLYSHMIKAMIGQIEAILSHHSKVHIIRFDLHQDEYIEDSKRITSFNRRFSRWLKRKYNLKRVGFIWCREQDKVEQQHYHYALLVDGHKVRYPAKILEQAKEIWTSLMGYDFTPKNCFYNVKRDDYDSIQSAIWRISYLAKVKTKGKKPEQSKDYSTSRVKYKMIKSHDNKIFLAL